MTLCGILISTTNSICQRLVILISPRPCLHPPHLSGGKYKWLGQKYRFHLWLLSCCYNPQAICQETLLITLWQHPHLATSYFPTVIFLIQAIISPSVTWTIVIATSFSLFLPVPTYWLFSTQKLDGGFKTIIQDHVLPCWTVQACPGFHSVTKVEKNSMTKISLPFWLHFPVSFLCPLYPIPLNISVMILS